MQSNCENNKAKEKVKRRRKRIRIPRYFSETFWGNTLEDYKFTIINESQFGAMGIMDNLILEYYATCGEGNQNAYAVRMKDLNGNNVANPLKKYRLNNWYIKDDIKHMLKEAENYLFNNKSVHRGKVRVKAKTIVNGEKCISGVDNDKIIILTINSIDDKKKQGGKLEVLKNRLLRITEEAKQQNTILDLETVCLLLNVNKKVITRCIKEYYKKTGKIIKLTGYNNDKSNFSKIIKIISLNNSGKSIDEISKIININKTKVEKYISNFSIVSKFILENRTLYIDKSSLGLELSEKVIRDNTYIFLELQSCNY